MPLFKFKVSDKSGKIQEILVEGENRNEATRRVRTRALIPIEFLGQSDSGGGSAGGWRFAGRFDVADFTDRLVPLLQADIPLERALGIIEETSETDQEKELISGLRRGLHEGRKLSQLIRDRGRMFPRMYASIVEAGEEAGALPQVLGQLRDYLLMTREMRGFVISSSIYPAFVLVVCVAVICLLLLVVVPKFSTIILSTTKDPSTMTTLLLGLSNGLREYWWIAAVAVILLLVFVRELGHETKAREWWDEISLKLPLVGHLVLLSNVGRQARTMAILMRNGVHLLDTVAISARVLSNKCLRESVSGLSADLRRGERLSVALGRSPYMPPMMISMLAVGEEMGATDDMLERVAERYDHQLKQTIKRALAWFEPLTIVLLGIIVGGIVLMLFTAVMDMQKSL